MKFSKLKLEIILMLVRDSHQKYLLDNLKKYTTSTLIQVIYMLEEVENRKFIVYEDGKYQLTLEGYQLLVEDNLESSFFELDDDLPIVREDLLVTYIPNKEREV